MASHEMAWAEALLEWLGARLGQQGVNPGSLSAGVESRQGLLWSTARYEEEAPAIRDRAELDAALEHLEYAAHRRFENELTRAERTRLDNSIRNAQFKIERYLSRLGAEERAASEPRYEAVRQQVRSWREGVESRKRLARCAELRLSQLATLTPEAFEDFVAEVFEAMDFEVKRVGGSGDDGIDLRLERGGLVAIVQCKYHRASNVVGSPELRRFLGSIQHSHSHKGYFVTTSTFSLSAERFAASHPIELVDGPRLVELIHAAMGKVSRKDGADPLLDFVVESSEEEGAVGTANG